MSKRAVSSEACIKVDVSVRIHLKFLANAPAERGIQFDTRFNSAPRRAMARGWSKGERKPYKRIPQMWEPTSGGSNLEGKRRTRGSYRALSFSARCIRSRASGES